MKLSSCVVRSFLLVKVPRRRRSVGEDREEELDLIQPVKRVGVKWKCQRGCAFEPLAHLGRLVHLQVVEDRVHLVVGRYRAPEQLEEVEELDSAVAFVDRALDLAGVDEQGCQERDGAVPAVLELPPGRLARPERDSVRIGSFACRLVFSSIETTISSLGRISDTGRTPAPASSRTRDRCSGASCAPGAASGAPRSGSRASGSCRSRPPPPGSAPSTASHPAAAASRQSGRPRRRWWWP